MIPTQPPPSSEELRAWVEANISELDQFSEKDQEKMDAFTRALNAENLKELGHMALSLKTPANQRILSLYLIGQSSLGEKELTDFLKEKIPFEKDAPVHSVNEAANGKEKALRVMAIQELIRSSPSKEEAQRRLQALIPSLKDPWLRGFAQRQLKNL